MRDGSQHAEMHNTPVIYRLQQRDTNVVVVTAASVGEASLQRLLGTISAVRAADGDSWWRGFWPGGDCSQRDEWTLRGGEETGELRRPRRPEPLRTEACTRPASSSNQVLRCAFLTLRCAVLTLQCAVLSLQSNYCFGAAEGAYSRGSLHRARPCSRAVAACVVDCAGTLPQARRWHWLIDGNGSSDGNGSGGGGSGGGVQTAATIDEVRYRIIIS